MKELIISDLDTIYGDNFDEMTLYQFLSKLRKNIKSSDYGVSYDEENNRFIVIYEGEKYNLVINDKVMNDFVLGKYNNLTYELKKLSTYQKDIDKELLDNKNKKEHIDKIIYDAEKKHILPNNYAKKIYLDYLKNNKNKNIFSKDLNKYFANFEDDIDMANHFNRRFLESKVWPFNGKGFFPVRLIILMILTSLAIIAGLLFGASYFCYLFLLFHSIIFIFEPLIIPVITFFIFLGKRRFKRLTKIINKYKLVKHMIKKIKAELKNSKLNINENDKVLEKKENKDSNMYQYTNAIYKEINLLVNKTMQINIKDRKTILDELKAILDEYNLRLKAILEENDNDTIVLGGGNALKLNMDIVGNIGIIETKINDLIKKEFDNNIMREESANVDRVIKAASCDNNFDSYDDNIYFEGKALTKVRKA